MTKDNIIKEIIEGNGNGYSIKEILQAHIKTDDEWKAEDREFKNRVLEKFEKGSGKIAENRARINSIEKILKYGITPIMLAIVGALIGLAFT